MKNQAYHNLSELIEKSYYHDLSVKEQITSRVNVVFTMQVAAIGLIGYIYKNIDFNGAMWALATVSTLTGVGFIFWILSLLNGFKAFSGGYNYAILPLADDLILYKKGLDISDHQTSEKVLSDYLDQKFAECSDQNSGLNIKRSHLVANAIYFLKLSGGLLLVGSIIFFSTNLDVSSERYKNNCAEMQIKEN